MLIQVNEYHNSIHKRLNDKLCVKLILKFPKMIEVEIPSISIGIDICILVCGINRQNHLQPYENDDFYIFFLELYTNQHTVGIQN